MEDYKHLRAIVDGRGLNIFEREKAKKELKKLIKKLEEKTK